MFRNSPKKKQGLISSYRSSYITSDMYLESTELKGAAVSRAKMKI